MKNLIITLIALLTILNCGKNTDPKTSDIEFTKSNAVQIVKQKSKFDPVLNCIHYPGFGCEKPPGVCPNRPNCK